jgi:hypothetical protein
LVLRLRIRICYLDKCVESTGVANTGFAGREPEIVLPMHIAKTLLGDNVSTTFIERVLADGTRALIPRTNTPLDVYVVAEDRVEGPVKSLRVYHQI